MGSITTDKASDQRCKLHQLVDKLMKRRKIARRRSQPLTGIYQALYDDLRVALSEAITQVIEQSHAQRRLDSLLEQCTADVLTYSRLTQLAVHLQQQPYHSPDWHRAMNELFTAVHLSNKLNSPKTYGSPDVKLDITHEALIQAIRDIKRFDPKRAHFIGWINQVYIAQRGRDILHRQKDTLQRSHHSHIMPIKYALGRILRRASNSAAQAQLVLFLKTKWDSIELDNHAYINDYHLSWSIYICLLQRQIEDEPIKGSQLLFQLAEIISGRTLEFDNLDTPQKGQDGKVSAKEIARGYREPPRIDFVRECLQQNTLVGCTEILQKTLKNDPKATFRAIALLRTEGRTLKEISQTFSIGVPAIQKFYDRNMSKVAAGLKQCVEDKVELWE